MFDHYYNDKSATRHALTPSGWVVTRDSAWIDDSGCLNLAGRAKDTIIINGVKWSASELKTAIEGEPHASILPSFALTFPTRAAGSSTESLAIAYAPAFPLEDENTRFETATDVQRFVSLVIGRKRACFEGVQKTGANISAVLVTASAREVLIIGICAIF